MVAGLFDKSVGFVVQARMASERLPGKVLMPMPFGSKNPLLSRIAESLIPLGGTFIIATSEHSENDAIEKYCEDNEIACFRGDEDDVLSRFVSVQNSNNFKYIFRFTADNPLIDVDKLSGFFESFVQAGVDYAYSEGMPLGMNFEVMKGSVLKDLNRYDLSSSEKEHVTLFIRQSDNYSKKYIRIADLPDVRMTVDTPLDYVQLSLITQVMQTTGLSGLGLVQYVRQKYPWLMSLNSGVLQKNSTTDTEKEINIIADLAETKGYKAAARKLRS